MAYLIDGLHAGRVAYARQVLYKQVRALAGFRVRAARFVYPRAGVSVELVDFERGRQERKSVFLYVLPSPHASGENSKIHVRIVQFTKT
jgi:hypothetical protein